MKQDMVAELVKDIHLFLKNENQYNYKGWSELKEGLVIRYERLKGDQLKHPLYPTLSKVIHWMETECDVYDTNQKQWAKDMQQMIKLTDIK